MKKVTEQSSSYHHLEKMTTLELVESINKEDFRIPTVIEGILEDIVPLIDSTVVRMQKGGRLFYIGAGTSGRLGILDASECPPTFGVPHEWVIGIIAGGDTAIRKAVEFAEDDESLAWKDLSAYGADQHDVVIGIAASGTTPYVVGGLRDAREHGIVTGCITCNPDAPIADHADFPIVAIVGPEFVTGSTRMKSGTAQKMILNMISTSVMIKLGRVLDNKMVDMQLSNNKLVDRGTKMIVARFDLPYEEARSLLLEHGSVRDVILKYQER